MKSGSRPNSFSFAGAGHLRSISRSFLLSFLLLGGGAHLRAQEASVRFSTANEEYRAGRYRDAVRSYEEVLANGYESAALYYNLGNAYYKTGNIPAAILNYERAKRITPDDEDILHNLRLANLRVVDKIDPLPRLFFLVWWEELLNLTSSGGWAAFAIAALWIAVVLILIPRALNVQRFQKVLVGTTTLAVIFAVFALTAAAQQADRESPGSAGIVFEATVAVKSAPDGRSTDLFVVHEGVHVRLMDSVDQWWKIKLADGKVGWIPENALRVI